METSLIGKSNNPLTTEKNATPKALFLILEIEHIHFLFLIGSTDEPI